MSGESCTGVSGVSFTLAWIVRERRPARRADELEQLHVFGVFKIGDDNKSTLLKLGIGLDESIHFGGGGFARSAALTAGCNE